MAILRFFGLGSASGHPTSYIQVCENLSKFYIRSSRFGEQTLQFLKHPLFYGYDKINVKLFSRSNWPGRQNEIWFSKSDLILNRYFLNIFTGKSTSLCRLCTAKNCWFSPQNKTQKVAYFSIKTFFLAVKKKIIHGIPSNRNYEKKKFPPGIRENCPIIFEVVLAYFSQDPIFLKSPYFPT